VDGSAARLESELSRVVAHRTALQEALAAAESERNSLQSETGVLRAECGRVHGEVQRINGRAAELHGALNVARAEKERLEAALEAALRVQAEQLGQPPATQPAAAQPPEGQPAAAQPAPAQPPAEVEGDGAEGDEAAPSPESAAEARPPRLRSLPSAPVVEVKGLSKSYRVPAERVETLKERVIHPLRSKRATRLEALRDVSFEIRRGEFFGIAGANGSGKSTLLKLLADVYAPDEGTIRTAGRLAPFIELGVGLNPEFAAYDNVVISGVMMGLEPEVARARYPEIIEFAGLEDFTELKLKNYSSGMRVRLAFAVMVQVDADILLIDEVLAVGDAEFREKCLERTNRLRSEGKTVVLVTHSMETLANQCDRAILLRQGEVVAEGDPVEVGRCYHRELGVGETAGGDDDEPVVRLVEG
jgi:ABC-type polysaccharide/polyol phosphate transport system ATPase subunit